MSTAPSPAKESFFAWALRWLFTIVLAVGLSLLLKTFAFQAFSVPSGSMIPELQVGDRFVAEKVSYRFQDVQRGDIVVFHPPINANAPADVQFYVKRAVGLPGDTIMALDGRVSINGTVLEEPYLDMSVETGDFFAVTLGADELYVLGDNRTASGDSRIFGPLKAELVEGRAVFLFWPTQRSF